MRDLVTGKAALRPTAFWALTEKMSSMESEAFIVSGPLGASAGDLNMCGAVYLATTKLFTPVADKVNTGARNGLRLFRNAGKKKRNSKGEVVVVHGDEADRVAELCRRMFDMVLWGVGAAKDVGGSLLLEFEEVRSSEERSDEALRIPQAT